MLYRHIVIQGDDINQFLVPKKIQKTILEAVHDNWGHQGITRTVALLQSRCFLARTESECKKTFRSV